MNEENMRINPQVTNNCDGKMIISTTHFALELIKIELWIGLLRT